MERERERKERKIPEFAGGCNANIPSLIREAIKLIKSENRNLI